MYAYFVSPHPTPFISDSAHSTSNIPVYPFYLIYLQVIWSHHHHQVYLVPPPSHLYINNINIEISKVTTWLQRNKLQLNVSKSKFMMFFKHPKTLPKLNITANGNLIDQVSEFNFL